MTHTASIFYTIGPPPMGEEHLSESRRRTFEQIRIAYRHMQDIRRNPGMIRFYRRFREARDDLFELARNVFEEERDLTHTRLMSHFLEFVRQRGGRPIDAVIELEAATRTVSDMVWYMDRHMGREMIAGVMVGKGDEREGIEFVQQCFDMVREELAGARAAVADLTPVSVLDEIRSLLKGRDWLALSDFMDEDMFDAALKEDAAAFFAAYMEECRRRIRAWRLERNRAKARFDRAVTRATSLLVRVLGPLQAEMKAGLHEATAADLVLVSLLIQRYHSELMQTYSPDTIEGLPPESLRIVLGQRWEFWYIVLGQVLGEHAGLVGASFAPWVIPLLVQLVHHPGKLTRVAVPQGAEKARTALAKRFAPFIQGSPLVQDGQRITESRLTALAPAESLAAIAQYYAGTRQARGTTPHASDRLIPDLWSRYLAPHLEEAVLTLAPPVQPVFAVEPLDILDLLAQWETEDKEAKQAARRIAPAPADTEMVGDEPDLTPLPVIEAEETPPPVPEKPARWFYVREPGRADLASIEVESSDTDRGGVLDAFFRCHGIQAVVKSGSIAAALEYFGRMPEITRALLPHETVGANTWCKLKRGRARILAQKTGEGDILFHIYHRREWDHRIHL